MIVLVVMEELERHFLDVHQIEENLWTLGSREKYYGSQQHDRTLAMSVGVAPGGAYSHYGRLMVGDAEVVFSTKTVWGIMRSQHRMAEHHFEYCEREFPDNLIAFVKLAAHNTQRCFSLSHSRMWDRRRRDIQRSRA